MTSPVINAQDGAKRGREVQIARAAKLGALAWNEAVTFQIFNMERRLTLADHATNLTDRTGVAWNVMRVKRLFASHGVTAKGLHLRVTTPALFEQHDWPTECYERWRVEYDQLNSHSDQNGEWICATLVAPKRAQAVRLKSGPDEWGQFVSEHNGQCVVTWLDMDQGETIERTVATAMLDVFVWHKSLEERQLESDRMRKRHLPIEKRTIRTRR